MSSDIVSGMSTSGPNFEVCESSNESLSIHITHMVMWQCDPQ